MCMNDKCAEDLISLFNAKSLNLYYYNSFFNFSYLFYFVYLKVEVY